MTVQDIREMKRELDAQLTALVREFEIKTDTCVFNINTFTRDEGTEVSSSIKIGEAK